MWTFAYVIVGPARGVVGATKPAVGLNGRSLFPWTFSLQYAPFYIAVSLHLASSLIQGLAVSPLLQSEPNLPCITPVVKQIAQGNYPCKNTILTNAIQPGGRKPPELHAQPAASTKGLHSAKSPTFQRGLFCVDPEPGWLTGR